MNSPIGVNMPEQSDAAWHPTRGLTLYGRKPALEALEDGSLTIHCLHLANSNRPTGIIAQITKEAERRGIAIRYHDRQALSRISKNGRQDQGVALDVVCPNFMTLEAFMDLPEKPRTVLALDGVTNPQNVGMIIRSAVAAGVDGLLYPKRGIASLGPLVIKASAGNVFRAPIIRCDATVSAVAALRAKGYEVATLEASGETSLFEFKAVDSVVCVLGGESDGIGREVAALADNRLTIPMANGVESLNVAVTAALVSFHLGQTPD
jgi:23S rRNA (guanosine2251-2'-O)-methyltransferase